jgi:DNA-binding NarL/FixJ family response regulator
MKLIPLTPDVSLNILIVGPDAATNERLANLISDPHRVVINMTTKTRHALLLAEWDRPDVVLLDLEMAGESLSKTISLLKDFASPPVVIVLALVAQPLLRRRCLELGASYVFDKTAELDQILATLQTPCDRKTEISRRKHSSMFSGPLASHMDAVAPNAIQPSSRPAAPVSSSA